MLFSGPYIGKCFELYGQYSESEVALMRKFVPQGGVVIDVGANIGDLTVPLSRMVGESGRVYAYESHPNSFNVLCGNLALNAIRNVKPINAFVAASDDVDTSSPTWGKFAFVSPNWAPQFTALDGLDVSGCDLIKVDVDGNELDVLRSGEMLIERFRPVIYFENDMAAKSEELLRFCMRDLKYNLYWHPAPIFDPDNFAGNRINHWAPTNVLSLMVLGIPSEISAGGLGLQPVLSEKEWWPGMLARLA
jgi:FkbM family methyltransferase